MQVVSVTFIDGGKGFNVIPNKVRFGGTLRALTSEGLAKLRRRTKEASFSSFKDKSNLDLTYLCSVVLYRKLFMDKDEGITN